MTLKSALGMIPLAGPFLSEIAGSIIPNQKVDRLIMFAAELDKRLSGLEDKAQLKQVIQNEEFTDLVEEGMRQASRSLSDERREYLAALIANSIGSKEIEHHESKHLMRILGELNDIEVIWLRSFISHGYSYGIDMAFREANKAVLEQYMHADEGDKQKISTLIQSYKEHLASLGLLERKVEIKESRNGSTVSTTDYTITMLGRMLLLEIGLIPDYFYRG
jgi:hypothetical protein